MQDTSSNQLNINQMLLDNYKRKYPSLANFTYDTNTNSLVYLGNYIKGIDLSIIDEIFFNLNEEDLFNYLRDGFYLPDQSINQVHEILSGIVTTETEIQNIEVFLKKYNLKKSIYANNKNFFDQHLQDNKHIQSFLKELNIADKIITSSKNELDNSTPLGIINELNKKQEAALEVKKQATLTRTKNNFNNTIKQFNENEAYLEKIKKNTNMSMAGFTSILLIIITMITTGIVMAITLLD